MYNIEFGKTDPTKIGVNLWSLYDICIKHFKVYTCILYN